MAAMSWNSSDGEVRLWPEVVGSRLRSASITCSADRGGRQAPGRARPPPPSARAGPGAGPRWRRSATAVISAAAQPSTCALPQPTMGRRKRPQAACGSSSRPTRKSISTTPNSAMCSTVCGSATQPQAEGADDDAGGQVADDRAQPGRAPARSARQSPRRRRRRGSFDEPTALGCCGPSGSGAAWAARRGVRGRSAFSAGVHRRAARSWGQVGQLVQLRPGRVAAQLVHRRTGRRGSSIAASSTGLVGAVQHHRRQQAQAAPGRRSWS